jgi:hypothetical protein
MWKEVIMAYFKIQFNHLLEGLGRTTKHINKGTIFIPISGNPLPGQDLTQGLSLFSSDIMFTCSFNS